MSQQVTVVVYRHRHGEDVSVYANPQVAYAAVATAIVAEELHEVTDKLAREHITALLAAGSYEEAVEHFNNASGDEHIDVSEDVIVTRDAGMVTVVRPACPKCTTTATDDLEIRETFHGYHPVYGVAAGRVEMQNALSVMTPSERFDDGEGDYIAHCRSCQHSGPPEAFGLGDPSEWVWV